MRLVSLSFKHTRLSINKKNVKKSHGIYGKTMEFASLF